jgi:hypothetical protein
MKYDEAMKKEALMHNTTLMKLENVTLKERSQSPKRIYAM